MTDQIHSRLKGTRQNSFDVSNLRILESGGEFRALNASDDSLLTLRAGGLVMQSGAQDGFVLTTDGSGVASWSAPTGGGGGGSDPLVVTKKSVQTKTLIQEVDLTADGLIDFDSIPQDYTDLRIEGRLSFASGSTTGNIRFNDDYGNNYFTNQNHFRRGNDPIDWYDDTHARFYTSSGAADENYFGNLLIFIPDYTNAFWKQMHVHSNRNVGTPNSNMYVMEGWNFWWSTSPITKISLRNHHGATHLFSTGSRVKLYGLKEEDVVINVSGRDPEPPTFWQANGFGVTTIDGVQVVTSINTGGYTPPKQQAMFTVAGDLVAGEHPLKYPNLTGYHRTIERVHASLVDPSDGQDVQIDVRVDGISIFLSNNEKVRVPDGVTSGESTAIENPNWLNDQLLSLYIDNVGTLSPGANLVVTVVYS